MEPSSVLKVRMPLPFRNDRVRGQRIKRVKTPTVLQMEAVECGAASLAIILGYYERTVPLEELRIACGVSRDGSKASNILKAARQYGLEAAGYRKEPNELRQTKLPVIIHWNFNHFLVLEGFKKDRVYLNDPAQGPRTVTAEEFDLAFTGVVLTFQPTANFVRGGEKQQILPALWRRLRGLEIPLVYVVFLGLLLAIPGLVIPIFSKIFIDQIMLGHRTDWLMPLVLGIALTALLRTGLNWMQQYYLLRLQTKIALKTSAEFFWHIIRLPVEFFNQRLAGEIGSRVMLNDTVAELLSGELASTVLSLIMIIFYFILMLQYSVILTFIGVAVAVLNILFLKFTTRIRQDQNLRLTMEGGKMQGTSMGGLSVIETLKATGAESDFFAKWAGYQAKLMSAQQEIGYSNMLLALVPSLLTSINNVVILAVGGYLILKGQMTVGMLVAFQSLMASFIGPVNQVVQLGGTLQEVKSDMNRLDDVFKYPVAGVFRTERNNNAPVADSGAAVTGDYAGLAKLHGSVELRNISFGYNRLELPLIENFSFVLKPGSRVALVGGSGSGKSTLAKVLSGLYEPWAGEILFDGRLRDTVPRSVLNFSLAVVDQEITMFEGTVKDNLTLWDNQITEAAMIKAAKDACIHDIIAARPAGYDTPMAEGGRNFSGGQLQRLEIARALINDPAILIMDEATSALDPQTEQLVDRAIRRRGCTCVIVAHRLSTIRDCDEIIVLDRGKVVQRGTHNDLKDLEGPYRELIKAQ